MFRPFGLSAPRLAGVAIAANLLTHGVLWSTFGLLPGPYAARLGVAETLVWLAEAGIYAAFGVPSRRALAGALAANALTTAIGLWTSLST
jgi:hypothetical protein